MKSPFTGGDTIKKSKTKTLRYKGEIFTIEREYYECLETGENFTTTELDQKAWDNIIRQYNERHKL